jgi:hypothetical protein
VVCVVCVGVLSVCLNVYYEIIIGGGGGDEAGFEGLLLRVSLLIQI